jgi:hypothetical protein
MNVAMITVMHIQLGEPEGDILLFLTGVLGRYTDSPSSRSWQKQLSQRKGDILILLSLTGSRLALAALPFGSTANDSVAQGLAYAGWWCQNAAPLSLHDDV